MRKNLSNYPAPTPFFNSFSPIYFNIRIVIYYDRGSGGQRFHWGNKYCEAVFYIRWRNKVGHSCSVIKFILSCISARQLPKGQSTKLRIEGEDNGDKVFPLHQRVHLPRRTAREESSIILNCFKFQAFSRARNFKFSQNFKDISTSIFIFSIEKNEKKELLSLSLDVFPFSKSSVGSIDNEPLPSVHFNRRASFYRDSIRRIHQGMAIPRLCESQFRMILYPSRGFIVQSGVPRTRTCRSRRLPPPAQVYALVHSLERARNRSAGSGRRPCEWATVLWSAAPLFFSLIGMRAEAGQKRSGRVASNNRREKWARGFETGEPTNTNG